jgi:hypothetical protein
MPIYEDAQRWQNVIVRIVGWKPAAHLQVWLI